MRRNRWIVESVQFFADPAQLARRVRDLQLDARRTVKSVPELVSTYLSLRGAQDIAERRIVDRQGPRALSHAGARGDGEVDQERGAAPRHSASGATETARREDPASAHAG